MPVQTHVVRVVFLVLCLSMLILQNGCSNSGSGQAEAPASNANAVQLALSTPSGVPAVMADGHTTLAIRLQVTNGSGAGMSDVSVTFATTAGELSDSPAVRVSRAVSGRAMSATGAGSSGSVAVTTDANGVAQVLLTSSTTAGTAVVTADALGFRTHIDISFVPGPSARVQLNASPTTVNASGTSTFTATVTDTNGNPVPGETVTFTFSTNSSGALLSPTSGTTDMNGQVTVKYTAGTAGGADTVGALATSTSVTGATSVTVTAPPPGTGAPVPSHIDLLVSSPQLGSNGAGNVTLTALVRDAANNVVSGALVRFSADSGGIQVTNDTTGATGTAIALLTTGGDQRNRTINVTATTGNISSTNTVQVNGTTLSISGASTLVLGATTRLFIFLRDSAGSFIPNQSISVSSVLGNKLSATAVKTDVTGQATVDVTASVPGDDTIQVSALAATATTTLTVSAANFVITIPVPAAQVVLNTPQTVTAHWDQAGVNQIGQTINFFATRGSFTTTLTCPTVAVPTISVQTDTQGNATVNICADNAGPAVISAAANMSSGPSSQVTIEFIATTVASLILQAASTTLGVNAPGNSTQQSVITAVVRDAQGNLVKNQTVGFSLKDVTGGQISPASAVTDSFGRASTLYTAGSVPSAKDGIVISAAIGMVQDTIALTVTKQALFVILGTGNVVKILSDTQYALPYSVLVTDATGNPVTNTTVELSVLPTGFYQKGFYSPFFNSTGACTGFGKVLTSPACQNEDSNFNGILDSGEDFNHNGRLDPGNVATVPGTVNTNATGFAFFDVVYAKEFTWVEVVLEARTVVAGSEGTSLVRFFLPGAVNDFNNCMVAPPGQISPYGFATTCTCDERTDPTCPTFTGVSPVILTTANTTLPRGGGIFTFNVSGGTQTSYALTTTAGTLSTLNVVFGQSFTLTLPPNPSTTGNLTITLTARDTVTGQQGSLVLTQLP